VKLRRDMARLVRRERPAMAAYDAVPQVDGDTDVDNPRSLDH